MKKMTRSLTAIKRRSILKAMAGIPFIGPLAVASSLESFEEKNLVRPGFAFKTRDYTVLSQLKGQIPHAKIKGLDVSRMMMGGNLMGGWAHARDLLYVSELVKTYHTEEKVFKTLQLAEQAGMNSLITNPVLCPVLKKYWDLGGKIQFISDGGWNIRTDIQKSIDAGAAACYVHGGRADLLASEGKLDEIAWALDLIRKNGIPAGIGAHELETVKKCVGYGLVPDFWMKTLHKTSYWSAGPENERKSVIDQGFAENIFCRDPGETIAFMNKLEQPWIAYKILAAGAIKPEDAFQWAFEQGADFICVGMFDFQVINNANLAFDVLRQKIQRTRPWR
jgi:hypothetical protein